jgi:metal-sulfur cluster biosynthetic enzyme
VFAVTNMVHLRLSPSADLSTSHDSDGQTRLAIGGTSRGCPTSGVAQRAVREAAPHAHGMSKTRQL